MGSISKEAVWYTAYTKPRSEKAVAAQLQKLGIDYYLPLTTEYRQWSDRKKKVQVPLFSSYIFVSADALTYYTALNIPGIVRFIHFGGQAAVMTEKAMCELQQIVTSGYVLSENTETFTEGEEIMIMSGPLKGFEGIMLRTKGQTAVIIQVDGLLQTIKVEVPVACIRRKNRTLKQTA